jgi:hypothetical protein
LGQQQGGSFVMDVKVDTVRGVLPSDGNKAISPYLGKTWTVSFMVPTTGSDGRDECPRTCACVRESAQLAPGRAACRIGRR